MQKKSILSIFAILILGLTLRIFKLDTIPFPYLDEGDFINVARNFSSLNLRHMGAIGVPISIQRPFFYFYLLAFINLLINLDVCTLRVVSVFFSLGLILFVYLISAARLSKPIYAACAAIFIACDPYSIFFNRVGFSYNLTFPLLFASIYFILIGSAENKKNHILLAALLLGLAASTDFVAMIFFPIYFLLFIRKQSAELRFKSYALILLPIFLCFILPIMFDFEYSKFRIFESMGTRHNKDALRFQGIVHNLRNFIETCPMIFIGLLGLPLIKDLRSKLLLCSTAFFAMLYFGLWRNLAGHYLMIFVPLAAIGWGSLVEKADSLVYAIFFKNAHIEMHRKSLAGILFIALQLFISIIFLYKLNAHKNDKPTWTSFSDGIFIVGFVSSEDLASVDQELRSLVSEDDLIIAPELLVLKFPSKRATSVDFITYNRANSITHDHFILSRYENLSLENVSYFFLFAEEELHWIGDQVNPDFLPEISEWPNKHYGQIKVYCNPKLKKCDSFH